MFLSIKEDVWQFQTGVHVTSKPLDTAIIVQQAFQKSILIIEYFP